MNISSAGWSSSWKTTMPHCFSTKKISAPKRSRTTPRANQRFLHIGFSGGGAGIWFLAADGPEQESLIGNQTHQQPTLVMYTDEFENLHERLRKNGVTINRPPVYGPDSWYLHFLDLYGNEIVLVQLIG